MRTPYCDPRRTGQNPQHHGFDKSHYCQLYYSQKALRNCMMESPNGSIIIKGTLENSTLDKIVLCDSFRGLKGKDWHLRRNVIFSTELSRVNPVGVLSHMDRDDVQGGVPTTLAALRCVPRLLDYKVTWFTVSDVLSHGCKPRCIRYEEGDEAMKGKTSGKHEVWVRNQPCCDNVQLSGFTHCQRCMSEFIFLDSKNNACVPYRGLVLSSNLERPEWHQAPAVQEKVLNPTRIDLASAWHFEEFGTDLNSGEDEAPETRAAAVVLQPRHGDGPSSSSGDPAADSVLDTSLLGVHGLRKMGPDEIPRGTSKGGVRSPESTFRRLYQQYLKKLTAYEEETYAQLTKRHMNLESYFWLSDEVYVTYGANNSHRRLNIVESAYKGVDPGYGFDADAKDLIWHPWAMHRDVASEETIPSGDPATGINTACLRAGWLPVDTWIKEHPELDDIEDPVDFCLTAAILKLYDPTQMVKGLPITLLVVGQWAFRLMLVSEYKGNLRLNEQWKMTYFPIPRINDYTNWRPELQRAADAKYNPHARMPVNETCEDAILQLSSDLEGAFSDNSLETASWAESATARMQKVIAFRNAYRKENQGEKRKRPQVTYSDGPLVPGKRRSK